MNIQAISAPNQVNSNKQNVAFGNYQSQITKASLKAAISSIDNDMKLGLSKGFFRKGLNSLTGKLWKTLQTMKKTYEKDQVVDVAPFIEGGRLWVGVQPSSAVKSKQFLGGAGQGNFGIFSESLISYGQNLKKEVGTHSDTLRKEYKHLVN